MQIARRIYIYLVAFISLQMLLIGAAHILQFCSDILFGTLAQDISSDDHYIREQFSQWAAVTVVGGFVWVLHWVIAQRSVKGSHLPDVEERQSLERSLMIYATLFVALWVVANAVHTIFTIMLAALPFSSLNIPLPMLLVYTIAWVYYWRVRTADSAADVEAPHVGTVRRWYAYAGMYSVLTVCLWFAIDAAGLIWTQLVGSGDHQPLLDSGNTEESAIRRWRTTPNENDGARHHGYTLASIVPVVKSELG